MPTLKNATRRSLLGGDPRGDFSAGFTGSTRLTAPNTASRFNPAHDVALTVAFFCYHTILTNALYYPLVRIDSGTVGNDGWGIHRAGSTNQYEVFYSNGANYFAVDGFTPVVNTWYLVIGTWANTGASPGIEVRVYSPSGAEIDSTNTGTSFVNASATGPLYVGGPGHDGSTGGVYIDKIGIWNSALSGANVLTLWNGGLGLRGDQITGAGLATNLAYYWDLDEGTGKAVWPSFTGAATLTPTGGGAVVRRARAGL